MKSGLLSSKWTNYFLIVVSGVMFSLSWGYGPIVGKLIVFLVLLNGSFSMSLVLVKKIKEKQPLVELAIRGLFLFLFLAVAVMGFFVPQVGLDALFTNLPSEIDGEKIEKQLVAFDSLSEPGAELFHAFGEAVGSRKVVALGESQHLTSEYSQIKVALVRYLHEVKGFNVLFFESPTASLQLGMRKMDLDCRSLSGLNGLFSIWQTREILSLFDYVIETQNTNRPLRLIGIDPQHFLSRWSDANEFLDLVMETMDTDLINDEVQSREFWNEVMIENKTYKPADPRIVQGRECYKFLVSRLREEIQANKNLPPDQILNLVLAEIVAEGVGVCLEIQTLEHPEKFYARDRSMAKNIINLAEGIFSESRIIIWAHNTHLCQEPVRLIPLKQDFYNLKNWWSSSTGPLALNTGSLLADHFGDDYFVLGLLTNSGRMGNFQSNDGWLPVRPPRQDSVESLLQLKSEPAVFLDLGKDSSIFAGKPLYFRSGGISWQKAYITKQFDSLVVVEKVSPPERLSKRDFQ